MQFITTLISATLDDPVTKLSPMALDRLHNPPRQSLWIDNPGHRHSISTYLAMEHSSKDAYQKICRSTARNFPGAQGIDDILSFHSVENLIASLTGIEKVQHDMCPNSCVAFTGPYANCDQCPLCTASHWNEEVLRGTSGRSKVPAKRFTMIPLGPQLQALYRDPDLAHQMRYLHEPGWDYLGAVLNGDIKQDDIILMVSLDGAQLYESKQSDCWIYIWVILNLAPDKRYKKVHVCPGGFIPGPNKPKNIDSFLFQQWDMRKMETGITKPPLILGLNYSRSLGVPLCMTTDLMHLAGNLSDLLISLWRGTMECSHMDNKDSWDWAIFHDEEVWAAHGQAVEDTGGSVPGSFDRKPRNIADKINTDYKTWEFHLYIFCLAPALLYSILPK
ncbi:hypothetical protein PISMIDRAFT_16720 [Pisolithus microcarpus 441]|uniref:Uncharacterized protein n=1 Tax=Pisolithus microcarpus 441 TaxID=765257 RepID=A0A0C9XS51_9AGAM|nr:hypothetical protein PISMIDRAFT_16720 [Pisolithus microcarpus 441]